jgi:hypothetical protein
MWQFKIGVWHYPAMEVFATFLWLQVLTFRKHVTLLHPLSLLPSQGSHILMSSLANGIISYWPWTMFYFGQFPSFINCRICPVLPSSNCCPHRAVHSTWHPCRESAMISMLPLPVSFSLPNRHVPWALNQHPHPEYSSSVGSFHKQSCYTIHHLQRAFQPCSHDCATPMAFKWSEVQQWHFVLLQSQHTASQIQGCIIGMQDIQLQD